MEDKHHWLGSHILRFYTHESHRVEDQPRPSRRYPLYLYLCAGLFLLVLGIGWAVGSHYFSSYELANGMKLSASVSSTTLEHAVANDISKYHLTIAYPDNSTKSFSLATMGIQVNPTATVQRLESQQKNDHSLSWWRAQHITLVVSYNKTSLQNFITNDVTRNVRPPSDATLSLAGGVAKLTAAVTGTAYGLPHATTTIISSVAALRTTPLRLQTIVTEPAITTASLATSQAKLQRILQQHIVLSVGDQTIIPKPNDIASWLTLTPNDTDKTIAISANNTKISAYINQLALAYNRSPMDQIDTYQTTGTSSVVAAGVKGLTVTGQTSAVTNLAGTVLQGNGAQIPVSVKQTGFGTVTVGSEGKWIDVNVVTKRMYAYSDTSLLKTFLVTAGARDTPTPTGVFHIWEKLPVQDMTGYNPNGTRYFQPNVEWINYFDHSGDAIHGNYWRPLSYFGNINSSHGCVGVIDSEAAWVYNWAPIGTPVVIHD